MHPTIQSKKQEFQAPVDYLQKELSSLRTGRANPAVLEDIAVPAYDSTMELKAVASITVQDPTTMLVTPWDKTLLQAVEKAIRDADIGLNPAVEGEAIRISIPPMTEETRMKIVKKSKEMVEEAKVAVRKLREKVREDVIKMEKDKEMGEDEKFKALEELDSLTKEYTAKVDELGTKKENEIMTV